MYFEQKSKSLISFKNFFRDLLNFDINLNEIKEKKSKRNRENQFES